MRRKSAIRREPWEGSRALPRRTPLGKPSFVHAMALALGALVAAGCFTPLQPGCAFSCAVDHLCPSGYVCADDGFCHRADDAGVCLLTPPDAAADATSDQSD